MPVCTFFGSHESTEGIYNTLVIAIEKLILTEKVDTFYVGNQGNFDRMVRKALADIKTRVPGIKCYTVLAYIPGKKREGEPPEILETIVPEGVEIVNPRFAIPFRNCWMVNRSDFVIAYPSNFGNSKKMMELATRKNKAIIDLSKHE